MDFQDKLSEGQKRFSLQIWEVFDVKYRSMGMDTSTPKGRQEIYSEMIKTLRAQGLEPFGDYVRMWKVYIDRGIKGVRETYFPKPPNSG